MTQNKGGKQQQYFSRCELYYTTPQWSKKGVTRTKLKLEKEKWGHIKQTVITSMQGSDKLHDDLQILQHIIPTTYTATTCGWIGPSFIMKDGDSNRNNAMQDTWSKYF